MTSTRRKRPRLVVGAPRPVIRAPRPLGMPERAAQERRYLRSDPEFLGVTVPDTRRTVRPSAPGPPGTQPRGGARCAIPRPGRGLTRGRSTRTSLHLFRLPKRDETDIKVAIPDAKMPRSGHSRCKDGCGSAEGCGSGTQAGSRDWQLAFSDLIRRWIAVLGGGDRVPANWDRARRKRPDADVLARAGFEPAGHFAFPVEHHWTLPELAGLARTLSVFPATGLAEHGAAFDAELGSVLGPYASDGVCTETVSFAYELARAR